jgi:hypothetical protein
VGLIIEIKGIGNELFEFDFGDFETGTVMAAAGTVAAGAWATVTLRTIAAFALGTVAAAIFTVGSAAAGTGAAFAALGTITLGTGFAWGTVALGAWRAVTLWARGALTLGPGCVGFRGVRYGSGISLHIGGLRFELDAEDTCERVLERGAGISDGRFTCGYRGGLGLGFDHWCFGFDFDWLCILLFGHFLDLLLETRELVRGCAGGAQTQLFTMIGAWGRGTRV